MASEIDLLRILSIAFTAGSLVKVLIISVPLETINAQLARRQAILKQCAGRIIQNCVQGLEVDGDSLQADDPTIPDPSPDLQVIMIQTQIQARSSQ